MHLRRFALLTVPVAVLKAQPAAAEWHVTAHVAGNIAGDVEIVKGGPGGSIGYVGDRLGFELDLERYQHFFKDAEIVPLNPAAAPNCTPGITSACSDINTDAFGLSANLIAPFRPRDAKWRPYATAGLGLIRAWTQEPGTDRTQNNPGFNAGGGLMASLSRRVGVRADLRYIRAFADETQTDAVYPKDYGFWRASVGVTLRFSSAP